MILAGSKAFNKIKTKDTDKVSLNELMQKKKSIDILKKDGNKDSLWKQMINNPKQ